MRAIFHYEGHSKEEQRAAVLLVAAELCRERVAEARVYVPEEAEEGAREAKEKVQKDHQLQVSNLNVDKCTSLLRHLLSSEIESVRHPN